jgi:hypothetical protein
MKSLLVPPFDLESARQKVRRAEDAWNSRNPEAVVRGYTPDCAWRNRSQFIRGSEEILAFLAGKWERELDYHLVKELWAYSGNRISVKFQYEFRNVEGSWFRAYGNENWQFAENGLMERREASINDVSIRASERKFLWGEGCRPMDYPGLTELGL